MSSFGSDSDSDSYGYDLTAEDEEELIALTDSISPPAPAPRRVPASTSSLAVNYARRSVPSFSASVLSLDSELDAAIAADETVEDITDDDLNFDLAELDANAIYSHASRAETGVAPARRRSFPPKRRPPPSSAGSDNASLASFVSRSRPRFVPISLANSEIRYPDREPAHPLRASPDLFAIASNV